MGPRATTYSFLLPKTIIVAAKKLWPRAPVWHWVINTVILGNVWLGYTAA